MSLGEELGKRLLVGDGAMGTQLYAFGSQRSHEELNLSHPKAIQEIHRSYIQAGADIIQTNSYAANGLKLERYGLQDQMIEINQAAVRNAKAATAGHHTYILGTIGGIYSPGERKLNDISLETIQFHFNAQLEILLEAGVDGILLETYYDINELTTALQIARKTTALPIITNITMQEVGRISSGESLTKALQLFAQAGANAVGSNCLLGPSHMAQAFESVPIIPEVPFAIYPNASLPAVKDGKIVYQKATDYFEKYGEIFRQQGAGIIGGCCGTTPDHIRAFKQGLISTNVIQSKEWSEPTALKMPIKKVSSGKRIDEKVKREKTILVELDPPRTLDTKKYFKGIEALAKAKVDKITISDNSLARPRISNLVLAAIIKKEYGIEPLVHLTTRDHNLIGMTSQIMGLHELGLFDILAITGDPAKVGDFPGATSVFDTTSMGLIKLIKQFNRGISYTGKNLVESSDFRVGAAFNPNVSKVERAARVMKKKEEAGADYIVTQPIFDAAILPVLKQAVLEYNIKIPLFIGIQPLVSSRNAEFLHNEIPGITISDQVRERMAAAEKVGTEKATGLEIAKELAREIDCYFQGFYLVTPFQNYEITAELANYVHTLEKTSIH